jgi:hypothetical protein
MGTLIAGTLTGTVGTLFDGAFLVGDGYEAVFDANNTTLVTEIGTLSGFIVHDGYFYLYDQEPLVVEGPVVADQINLTADGQLTLDGAYGGGFFISSTIANSLTTAASGLDSSLVVNPYGGQDDIVELGTFYINAGPLAATYNSVEYLGTTNRQATLFMSTGKPNQTGGNISFATATAGLYAPDVELFLSGGTQGALTGNVNVAHLIVQSGLLANLTGSINNFYGQPAAGQGTVQPQPQSKYQFNACPIGSVNCVILAIESLPVENPLQNFDLTQRKRRHLDKSVRLPGIGTRDY